MIGRKDMPEKKCEKLTTCPFFNNKMNHMPRYSQSLKEKYCRKNWRQCARHIVYLHQGAAPLTLFPDDLKEARSIIKGLNQK